MQRTLLASGLLLYPLNGFAQPAQPSCAIPSAPAATSIQPPAAPVSDTGPDIAAPVIGADRIARISTYCYLAGGVGFLALWTFEALLQPSYASLPYILGLIGLCGVFFLSAFYNALINWQARTLRLGTAREFLATDDSWWPS